MPGELLGFSNKKRDNPSRHRPVDDDKVDYWWDFGGAGRVNVCRRGETNGLF